jgi:two-component system, NarL family, sensor kinase
MTLDTVSRHSELARRNRELSILNSIAEALNREVDLAQSLNTALGLVAKLFDLQTAWVFLLDEETGKFYTAATLNLPPALGRNPRRLGGTCYCLDTYRDGDLDGAANVNVITCTRLENLVDGTDGLRYHASIPLYAYDKQLGVLNVASTDWQELSYEDLCLLHTVGDLLSMAIERARLFTRSADIGAMSERNRLAREIHDTIAQGLAAIALQLETADALLESNTSTERVQKVVEQALTLTRANLEEARRSVLDLRPAPLEGHTLPEALTALIEENAAKAGYKSYIEISGGIRRLPVRVEVGLYRIAQETLTNIGKHANARNVTVELMMMPDYILLTIEDDGDGFESCDIPEGHFGLIGLNERAKLLGGKLNVCSEPGTGTLIEVTIPLGTADA